MRGFMIGLVVVCVLTVGLFWYMNWIQFSWSSSPDGGSSELKVKLNKKEMSEEVSQAGEKIRKTVSQATDALKAQPKEKNAEPDTVRGMIRTAERDRIVLTAEGGKEIIVHLNADTRIRQGDRNLRPDELREGMNVQCRHETRDGRNVCLELVVQNPVK